VEHPEIDFATVLASAVHDMKNSLCMLLQSMDSLRQELAETSDSASSELSRIHYEANRLNSNLLQLLALYRIEKNQLPLHQDEYPLQDMLEELVLKNEMYSTQRQILVEVQCDSDLCWFFDDDLVSSLLNDMLINAMRYSKSKILLKAFIEDNWLVVQIHDDGSGYPIEMLEQAQESTDSFHLSAGRTGLGLFFAKLIAEAHRNHERAGRIEMQNHSEYGGALFSLYLP